MCPKSHAHQYSAIGDGKLGVLGVNLHDDSSSSPYLIVPKDFFDDSKSPYKVKPQAVSVFSENHLPESQTASSVSLRHFQRIISPNLKSQGVPLLRFFRESSPQISNRKLCPPRISSEHHLPKSQMARCVPSKLFQRIKSPNLKSQGVSL